MLVYCDFRWSIFNASFHCSKSFSFVYCGQSKGIVCVECTDFWIGFSCFLLHFNTLFSPNKSKILFTNWTLLQKDQTSCVFYNIVLVYFYFKDKKRLKCLYVVWMAETFFKNSWQRATCCPSLLLYLRNTSSQQTHVANKKCIHENLQLFV